MRLAERSVLVLTSLAGGDRHGYALIKDIESFSGVALSPGTLYGALAKLEADGFVQRLPADDRRYPYTADPGGPDGAGRASGRIRPDREPRA